MLLATTVKLPTVAFNDDTVGTYDWIDPDKILASDSNWSYTTMYIDSDKKMVLRDLRLTYDGQIIGTNIATNTEITTSVGVVSGSNSNLWGATLDRRMVQDPSFGVALSVAELNSSNVLQGQTKFLVGTGFGFKLPRNATIAGIAAQTNVSRSYAGPGIDYAFYGALLAVIHYNWDFDEIGGDDQSTGYLMYDDYIEPEIPQDKHYQYMAYEKNEFRGEWPDVETIPTLKLNVNELPGQLPVTLARNLDTREVDYDSIELSGYGGEELITTQNSEIILAGEGSSYGVGSGTDLEVNHTIKVKEYYGGYEGLLTHDGEPLLTSQLEPLVVPNGYPMGRDYYQGFVSDFGLLYDVDKQNTSVKILHLSEEMNNIVYRTPDTLKRTTYDAASTLAYGFGVEKYPGETERVGYTFTADSTYKLKRIVMKLSGWRDNIITASIFSGGTMGAGTLLGTAEVTIDASGQLKKSFSFPESVQITNGQSYNVIVSSQFIKQTMSQNYPAFLYVGSIYADGTNYTYKDGAWVAADASFDIGFELWQEGGNTRVSELSVDPSNIMKKVLDYGSLQGGVIKYSPSSIILSNTVVSAPFNTNTEKEAADYILKLTPSNWFYFINPGDLLFNLRPQPSLVSQWFTHKYDVIKLDLHKNIESIINDVLFTGGGDPALFTERVDAISQKDWRKGLVKTSDNRVTDTGTAEIVMGSMTDQNSQPIWIGTVEILRANHPKMIFPGELAGFLGYGNIIDFINVLIVSVDVTPDKFICELGARVPKTSQRIEDIRRNLTRIEIENNPNAPV